MESKLLQDARRLPSDDVAILVSSCDKYQDLWAPFFTFLFKYWPGCPFRIYLIANFKEYRDPRVMTIRVGKDQNWSSAFARALKQISHRLVIVLMEDYFLDKPVDTQRIVRLAEYMKSKAASCLRLLPSPGPDMPCEDNPLVGELKKGAAYRLSLQAAIWDKNALLGLLRWGETAWELEVLGSRRTDNLEAPFLSVPRDHPALTYQNAVIKGRWDPEVVEFCRKENVALELPMRPTDSGPSRTSMNPASRYMRALRRRVRFRQRSLSLRSHWHRL